MDDKMEYVSTASCLFSYLGPQTIMQASSLTIRPNFFPK